METKPIKDFTVEDRIEGFFVVRRKEVLDFTRGKYVRMELGDASGRIQAVWWDPDQFGLEELEGGMVVKVRGQVSEYKQRPQLTLQKMRLAQDGEYDLETILRRPQPYVSKQLAILREAGLVSDRRDGLIVYYRLQSERVMEVVAALRAVSAASSVVGIAQPAVPERPVRNCPCPKCEAERIGCKAEV